MILTCRLQTGALAGTAWLNFTADDFKSLGAVPGPVAGWRFRSITVLSVATQAISLAFGSRIADVDGGTRGFIVIPEAHLWPALDGTTLTIGTLVVTFRNSGTSTGTVVSTNGKSREDVVAEVVTLITAAATGIGDIEDAAGDEPGSIILHSDASSVVQATWTPGPKAAQIRFYAAGLAPSAAIPVAVGATLARRQFLEREDVRVIAIRPNVANADVLLEAEIERAGWPQR